jgi:hypothetical protein
MLERRVVTGRKLWSPGRSRNSSRGVQRSRLYDGSVDLAVDLEAFPQLVRVRKPGPQPFYFQRFGHFTFSNNNPSKYASIVMIAAIR